MISFAATILLSAFLLFLVQPIIAKQILPWFGGTSAVWTTCLVFFQVMLLAGYAYAHFITRRLAPKQQALLHIGLLLISLVFLPIVPSVGFKPVGQEDAALLILLLLAATIGLPYFLLSSTGPLLQAWVAHRFPEKTVYRLFALSNLGSLIGLLAFPFAIEPFASSRLQSWVWSAVYALFALLCAAVAWSSRQRSMPAVNAVRANEASSIAAAPSLGDYALWLILAALGSVLLLASTSHITQNVASVPFLWVLPLTLYLLTFVLAFEGRSGRGWYEQRWFLLPTLALLVAMAWGLEAQYGVLDVGLAVPLYCVGMFFACFYCHGELASRKPAAKYLTHFYLSLSAGGALGGLFVGLIAPRVFSTYYELPLALGLACALALWVAFRRSVLWGVSIVATIATVYFGFSYANFLRNDVVLMQRNFYGALRVREVGSGDQKIRSLLHGVILHGKQLVNAANKLEPGTYYARSSGVGLAIESKQARGPIKLGVVGLGVGTLTTYGRAGDTVHVYELDPDVLSIARNQFSYLSATQAQLSFALGDARLSLEREAAAGQLQRYDVLAVDAFSSDSIPVHLLTREAIELYTRHLAPDGVIAMHISNRFLDLQPVLANIGQALNLTVRHVRDDTADFSTDWVLITKDPAVFATGALAQRSEPLIPVAHFSLWTDQFNNLIDVLRFNPLTAWHGLLNDR